MHCAFPPYASLFANAGWGPGGSPSIAEVEELDGVASPDLALIGLGDVGVDLFDDRPRVGPFVLDVREVGGEHDPIDTDMLALFDRHPLVLHAEIDVVAHVVAPA